MHPSRFSILKTSRAWNLQVGNCGCNIHTHIPARKAPQLSFTDCGSQECGWNFLQKQKRWVKLSLCSHTHWWWPFTGFFFFFFYLFEEYWASLTFTSSFLILPLFSPCLQPATLGFSGLKAVRGDYRFLGSVLRAPGSSGPIKELEHLPGKKHPWSRQVTPVKLLGGHFPLTIPCYKSIGRIKSFNKKISGHLRALGKMACWCTTHIVWMNKEEKPNSSVMSKHLSTKMFHKKKKIKMKPSRYKIPCIKNRTYSGSSFLFGTCFSNGINIIRNGFDFRRTR